VEGTEQPPQDDYVYALRDEAAYLQGDDQKPPIPSEPSDWSSIVCQFCGKTWNEVRGVFQAKRRVRDPNTSALSAVWICNECVTQMAQILAEEPAGTPWLLGWEIWSQPGAMRP
jgi:ClpX C4-type zinc finger